MSYPKTHNVKDPVPGGNQFHSSVRGVDGSKNSFDKGGSDPNSFSSIQQNRGAGAVQVTSGPKKGAVSPGPAPADADPSDIPYFSALGEGDKAGTTAEINGGFGIVARPTGEPVQHIRDNVREISE